jgi:thiosulfate/3-mercaptopyruvate sulfurtransferase
MEAADVVWYHCRDPTTEGDRMFIRRTARALLTIIAALTLIAGAASAESEGEPAVDDEMGSIVTTEWLNRHLDDPDLVVLDCTVSMVPDTSGGFQPVSGRPAYEAGHIPTAGFADLSSDLADTASPLNYAMPTPERFCEAMGSLGVGDDSRVVLYDGLNSVWAARVWWMLRWVGFDRAAVLDGGLGAWTAEERPMSTEPVEREVRELTADLRPELIAYRDEVFDAMTDDSVSLIDVMPEPHFRGEMAMYDRPGHIPSAENVSVMALLDESVRFRTDEELAALFKGDKNARMITYCGGGIAASATALVMTRLGYTDVAVYMASLQEWAADPDLPLLTVTPDAPADGAEPSTAP